MASQKNINQFIANKPIAVAGVSRNPKKFGRIAFEELTRKGLQLIPINPNIDEINGVTCYKSVAELPAEVHALIILTKKDQTAGIVEEALSKGISNLWIQQGSETKEALELIKDKDLNVITKQCIMMFHEPDSFHRFHRNIKRFFGGLPK